MAAQKANLLKQIQKVNIEKPSDIIIRQIQELISKGVVKPGDKLPAERELAESFNVGRGHIREAIKKLEFYGILETYPQDGTYVSGLGAGALEGLIRNILKLNNSDLQSLVETRSILETEAIKLTCERASDKELKEIESAHLEYQKKVEANENGLDEDLIFHLKISEFCHNSVLFSMISLLTPEMLKISYQKKSCADKRYIKALDEHEQILKALRSRNPDLCVKAMGEHMANTLLSFQSTKSD